MAIKEKDKNTFLELIKIAFDAAYIDLKELNNNFYGPYRQIRPYNKCSCWALEPDEEMEWHIAHLNRCVKSLKQLMDLEEDLLNVIDQEGKRFGEEKEQVIKRIENKAREINYKDKFGKDYKVWKYDIIFLRNRQEVEKEEKKHLTYLENLANTWQKNSEAEKEKLKKQEEERINREQQKNQAEEIKNKKQEEEIKQKKQEFKSQVEEEGKETNPKSDKKTNDLKSKFNELYQKGKKYNWYELMTLLNILEKIEKETGLDDYLKDAKNELKNIQDKLTLYQSQTHLITSREGETIKEKLKGLDKYQLENCKKALEGLKEIIHLFDSEEHLLKEINNKLQVLNLEEEIKQLKSNKIKNPQQQEEIQKKIEEKERELEEMKKQFKSEENKQFQISPQILSKFSSLSNFDTKEKIEALINPIKNNPDFFTRSSN